MTLEHKSFYVFLHGVSFTIDGYLPVDEGEIRIYGSNYAKEDSNLPQVVITMFEDGIDVGFNYADEYKGKNDGCRKECEAEEVLYGSNCVFHTANIVKILYFLIFASINQNNKSYGREELEKRDVCTDCSCCCACRNPRIHLVPEDFFSQ
jgi:hypothetical protein